VNKQLGLVLAFLVVLQDGAATPSVVMMVKYLMEAARGDTQAGGAAASGKLRQLYA
jgi:hypothetical protein